MKVENLVVNYDRLIIDSTSFETEKNGIYIISGPSGAGKSTMLKAIAGLIKYSGTITETGKIAYLFQDDILMPWLTLKENVYLPLEHRLQRAKADYYINAFGLKSLENKKPDELSGGQRRRCALARMFAYGGDTYLMDEPFVGLDDENANKIIDEIKKQQALFLIVTHEKDRAKALGGTQITASFCG